MNSQDILTEAQGRSIVVGEGHFDRKSLKFIVQLMRKGDTFGYKHLGVERSNKGIIRRGIRWPGLKDKIMHLRLLGEKPLPQCHDDGYPRSNSEWEIQLALQLEWDVIAVDPYYWDGFSKRNRFRRRDPAMSQIIRKYEKMICVVGASHLKGIHARLGDHVLYVNAVHNTKRRDEQRGYVRRFDFYKSVLQLTE